MRVERIGDVALHVSWRGPGGGDRVADAPPATATPTLAFVHSLGTDLRLWDGVLEHLDGALADAGVDEPFAVLRHDLRGHGLSARAPGSIADHAEDLATLLERYAPGGAIVVGVSVGGLVAQALAAARPELVRALVLANTGLRIGTAEAWTARGDAVEAHGLAPLANDIVERWFGSAWRAARPAALEGWRRLLERQDGAGYADLCRALADADLTSSAASLDAPCLCIAGEEDTSTPPTSLERLAGAISGARVATLDGLAHLPMAEAPARFAERLAAFVAETLDGGRPVRESSSGSSESPGDRHADGLRVRREVLGDAHVERALARTDAFDAAFQRLVTEGAWGTVWASNRLPRRERSMLTLALLAGLGNDEEFALHVRATARTGVSREALAEVLQHVAIYAGVPRANTALRIARATFADTDREDPA